MIIDKHPLPDDAPYTDDAPPAYDQLTSPQPRLDPSCKDFYTYPPSAHPSSPRAGPSSTQHAGTHSSSAYKPVPKSPGWFSFGTSWAAAREVRETVLSLVRGIVQNPPDDTAAAVLVSCADACVAQGLDFPSILQERSIEGHTPIYWAILKRPKKNTSSSSSTADGSDIVHTLLARSAPLTAATIADIRLACLLASDNALFQALRRAPEFAPARGTDRVLLGLDGEGGQVDEVLVEDVPGEQEQGVFVARLRLPAFQRRMRVSRVVEVEFIARGRLWSLAFLVWPVDRDRHDRRRRAWGPRDRNMKPGTWHVSLALLADSPPTYLDSRLIIEDAVLSAASSPFAVGAPPPAPPPGPSSPLHSPSLPSSPSSSSPPSPALSVRRPRLEKKRHSRGSSVYSDSGASVFSDMSDTTTMPGAHPAKSKLRKASSSSISNSGKAKGKGKYKPRTPIQLRVRPQSTQAQLAPPELCHRNNFRNEVTVPLEECREAESLQFDDSPYIAPDGTLYARFEARLAKPDNDCVIC